MVSRQGDNFRGGGHLVLRHRPSGSALRMQSARQQLLRNLSGASECSIKGMGKAILQVLSKLSNQFGTFPDSSSQQF